MHAFRLCDRPDRETQTDRKGTVRLDVRAGVSALRLERLHAWLHKLDILHGRLRLPVLARERRKPERITTMIRHAKPCPAAKAMQNRFVQQALAAKLANQHGNHYPQGNPRSIAEQLREARELEQDELDGLAISGTHHC